MKTLFIAPNLEGGGAQKALLKLARGLTERGHDARVLIFERHIEHFVPDGLTVEALLPPGRQFSGGWLGKRVLAWRLRKWFRNAASKGAFDLIISTLPFTDEVVRLAGLPGVWYRIANTLSGEIANLAGKKAKRRRARYIRLYDRQNIIAVSQGVAEDLQAEFHLANSRIEVIYNPFDFGEMVRLSKERDADLPNVPYLLHVGRFARQKRHDVLFDAYKASGLPHQLVLLTQPNPALTDLITARGLTGRVVIAGFRKNPYPWYANAAAVLLTSDFEGMPNVLIEALACGVPVVSTDCPSGPREVLTHSMRRFLVPRGDTLQIARRLQEIVESRPDIDKTVLAPFEMSTILEQVESLAAKS